MTTATCLACGAPIFGYGSDLVRAIFEHECDGEISDA
jgi:hypothetical protein